MRPISIVLSLGTAVVWATAAGLAPTSAVASPAQGGPQGYWQQEKVESSQKDFSQGPCYQYTYAGGAGGATLRSTAICDPKHPWNGSGTGVWSTPPAVLVPGQTVQMSVAGRASASNTGIGLGLNIMAAFDAAPCGASRDRVAIVWLTLASHDPARQALEQTGTAIVPGYGWAQDVKELGGRLQLKVCMEGWQTYYLYAWKPGPPPTVQQKPFKPVTPPPPGGTAPSGSTTESSPAPDSSKAAGTRPRCRSSSGSGYWIPIMGGKDPEGDWAAAAAAAHHNVIESLCESGGELPWGAGVQTGERSRVEIAMPGGATVFEGPETRLILREAEAVVTEATKRSAIRYHGIDLVFGQAWVDFEKYAHPTLQAAADDFETLVDKAPEFNRVLMQHVIALITGTTFEVRQDASGSKTSVCRGTVRLEHRKTGRTLTVGEGDVVLTTASGFQTTTRPAADICHEFDTAKRGGNAGQSQAPATVLFDNGNPAGVLSGPTASTTFTVPRASRVTLIQNYHWNGGTGEAPGTIALRGPGGIYGPWQAEGRPAGAIRNVYWVVRPEVTLPAGTYTVEDSNPSTWSQNTQSRHAGMTRVEGSTVK